MSSTVLGAVTITVEATEHHVIICIHGIITAYEYSHTLNGCFNDSVVTGVSCIY